MAFDERFAQRIRGLFDPALPVTEKRMFGGIAYMVGGYMCAGVVGSDLMLRVGPNAHGECLKLPHAKPMDFTGRPIKGFIYVVETGKLSDADLRGWLARGLSFVRSLPAK